MSIILFSKVYSFLFKNGSSDYILMLVIILIVLFSVLFMKTRGLNEENKLYKRVRCYMVSIPVYLVSYAFILKWLVNKFQSFTDFIFGYELIIIIYSLILFIYIRKKDIEEVISF